MPWPRHNGRSGNLPKLMMPVWPRLEEVENKNLKEAHSCTAPALPISPSLSISRFSLIRNSISSLLTGIKPQPGLNSKIGIWTIPLNTPPPSQISLSEATRAKQSLLFFPDMRSLTVLINASGGDKEKMQKRTSSDNTSNKGITQSQVGRAIMQR